MSVKGREMSESGMLVYPKLPVPKAGRESDSKLPRAPRMNRLLLGVIGAVFVLGVVVGFAVRPSIAPDGRISELEKKVVAADKATASQKSRAEELDKEVEKVKTEKKDVAAQLEEAQKAQTMLADTAAEAEKKKKDAEDVMAKLKTAAGGAAVVAVEGGDVRVALNENFLFKANDDELTEPAVKVLDKIAIVLKETPSRMIAVNGHTSNQQPPQPPRPAPPPPPKKGQKPVPAPPVPESRFPTNWELSGLRALAVVRYLQDKAKVEPARMSATAFGQYRGKAGGRRIELVLTPKPKR